MHGLCLISRGRGGEGRTTGARKSRIFPFCFLYRFTLLLLLSFAFSVFSSLKINAFPISEEGVYLFPPRLQYSIDRSRAESLKSSINLFWIELAGVMDRKNQSPQGQTAKVVVEFLEVAINCIVFLKGFYPSRTFERRRYMNVVVNKARHPQLSNYIHNAVFALLPYIQKGLVERVVVIFYGEDHVPLEKFVFKLTIDQSYQSSVSEAELEFALRAFLVKLNAAETISKPLPSGANWEITAYFRNLPSQENEGEEAKLWVPTDTKQWMQTCEITPIKSMDSDPLK